MLISRGVGDKGFGRSTCYCVAPVAVTRGGLPKKGGGRHLPNNGLTSFLAGERGAGGHVVISKRQRGAGVDRKTGEKEI